MRWALGNGGGEDINASVLLEDPGPVPKCGIPGCRGYHGEIEGPVDEAKE